MNSLSGWFCFLAYFWCSGNYFYGNEPLLQNVQPALLFGAIPIGVLVLAVPMTFMSVATVKHVTSRAPGSDGGMISAVEMAWGARAAAGATALTWVSYIIDAAVYPCIAGEYLKSNHWPDELGDLASTSVPVAASVVVIVLTVGQLLLRESLGPVSAVLAILGLLPVFVLIIAGGRKIDAGMLWSNLPSIRDSRIGLLLCWTLWIFQGYASVGQLIAEVHPAKHGVAVAVVLTVIAPLVALTTFLPLAVAWGESPEQRNFDAGAFEVTSTRLVAGWFGQGPFVAGVIVAELVLLNSASMAAQHVLHQAARVRLPRVVAPEYAVGQSRLYRWLFVNSRRGPPAFFVLFTNMCVAGAVWIDYTELIQIAMLTLAPVLLLFAAAHVQLQRRKSSAVLAAFLLAGYICVMTYFALEDDDTRYSEPRFKAIVASLALVLALVAVLASESPGDSRYELDNVRDTTDLGDRRPLSIDPEP